MPSGINRKCDGVGLGGESLRRSWVSNEVGMYIYSFLVNSWKGGDSDLGSVGLAKLEFWALDG